MKKIISLNSSELSNSTDITDDKETIADLSEIKNTFNYYFPKGSISIQDNRP